MSNPRRRKQSTGSEVNLDNAFPELKRRVRMRMKKLELDVDQLVERSGVSKPSLYRLIKGQGNPQLVKLLRVADALETSVAGLLGPQRALSETERPRRGRRPLLATPPQGDPRSLQIYRHECACRSEQYIRDYIDSTQYLLPGELYEAAVTRAILDTFDHRMSWCAMQQKRSRSLEKRIVEKYDMAPRKELSDPTPVRVVQLPGNLLHLVKIHALAAVAAAVVKELAPTYSTIGFADGFTVSTVQKFLVRGSLSRAFLVPLVFSPRFAGFEFSGQALIGAMARTHQGYEVKSTIALGDLHEAIGQVNLAITSCGAVEKEEHSRQWRLIRAASPKTDYVAYLEELKNDGIAGDLMYHFLKTDGEWIQRMGGAKDLEAFDLERMPPPEKDDPAIYSVSPVGLARIASRGVTVLIAHSVGRAKLMHAALSRDDRPVNFIVTDSETAASLLEL